MSAAAIQATFAKHCGDGAVLCNLTSSAASWPSRSGQDRRLANRSAVQPTAPTRLSWTASRLPSGATVRQQPNGSTHDKSLRLSGFRRHRHDSGGAYSRTWQMGAGNRQFETVRVYDCMAVRQAVERLEGTDASSKAKDGWPRVAGVSDGGVAGGGRRAVSFRGRCLGWTQQRGYGVRAAVLSVKDGGAARRFSRRA